MTAAAFAAWLVLVIADNDPSQARMVRSCSPKDAEVLASNGLGAVYRERGNIDELVSCRNLDGSRRESIVEEGPQPASFDAGGLFYAYATFFQDEGGFSFTSIFTRRFTSRVSEQEAVVTAGSAPPVDQFVEVTQLRVAANHALVWVACEFGFPPGPFIPEPCLRGGRRR